MTVKMLNYCLSELCSTERLAFLDCIMFAKLLNMRVTGVSSNEVAAIWALGNRLEPSKSLEVDFICVVNNAAMCCKSAFNKFVKGQTDPESWGLTFEEYYLFNRVVVSNLANRLNEVYFILNP